MRTLGGAEGEASSLNEFRPRFGDNGMASPAAKRSPVTAVVGCCAGPSLFGAATVDVSFLSIHIYASLFDDTIMALVDTMTHYAVPTMLKQR